MGKKERVKTKEKKRYLSIRFLLVNIGSLASFITGKSPSNPYELQIGTERPIRLANSQNRGNFK